MTNPADELEIDLWLKQAAAARGEGNYARAVELCQKVLTRRPGHAGALAEMAHAACETGAFEVAEGLAQQALHTAPRLVAGHLALGRVLAATSRPEAAIAAYRKALAVAPRDAATFVALGEAQLDVDDRDSARKSFRMAVKLKPDYPLAAHMLAALEDGAATPRNAYASALFDQYAESFEDHLSSLGYDVPAHLRRLVEVDNPRRRYDVALDLGCGTGLAARAFGGLVDTIDGIDIAPKMIDAARATGIYRSLEVADVAPWLARQEAEDAYDLMIAADVFIYVGRLEDVFAGVARALRRDGRFAFSVEHLESANVAIRSSGRFAHSPDYIRTLAESHGFVQRVVEEAAIRSERNTPIPGWLFVLGR
jgi:predicted TPR repeat methyltransferase